MRLNVYILAILWQTVLPVSRVVVDADTCDLVDVTAPVSLRDSTGWDRDPAGAGERRQGHISAEIQAWGQDHIVVYGGTSVRTDGVNDVTGGGSRVSILDISSQQNWTELEMVAYDGRPSPLFRPASFVWGNSLFLVAGHTDEPFTVTHKIWRADIQGFDEAPEGLWRPVNATTNDSLGSLVSVPRYAHTATVLNTGDANPTEAWVVVIGGMSGSQNSLDNDLILHLYESTEEFVCEDEDLNVTSTYTCAQRTPTRPTETHGEWWLLDPRLSTNSSKPAARSYHSAVSLATNGLGNSACLYMYGGRDYEMSILFSDLWSLCPVNNYLGGSGETTFTWTELSPIGTLPKGRYGATFVGGIKDAPYRILLYGGTGRYPNSYMDDDFTQEYDTYMNAWVESSLEDGSSDFPVGRRDHTMEGAGDFLVLIAGIDNSGEALQDMWSVNYSSPVCGSGNYMFFCESTSTAVCGTCPDGTATERASYTCEDCTSGYFAEAGSRECSPCPAGKYGTGDRGVVEETACTNCPAGTSTTYGVGTSSESGCLPCEAGTYSLEGALVCSPCPSGFFSDVRASECIPCPVGKYRQQESVSGSCYDCPAGTYAPFEQTSVCNDCPQGYYTLSTGAGECTPCPAGEAGSSVASDACTLCPGGAYSSEVGSVECERCPAGTASAGVGEDSDVCQVCPIGEFAGVGASSCQECVAGQYNVGAGAETCELCPLGTYVTVPGSTSAGDCEYCPQGSTTLAAGSNSTDDCLPCPPGTRTVTLADGGGCEDCPRGEYTSTEQEAQDTECLGCVGGFFADTTGSDVCTECPDEQLSYSAHATCLACITNTSCPLGPNGETCSGVGSCNIGVCDCDNGFSNVDCSSGTASGFGGVFGFDYDSVEVGTDESDGTVSLTIVRFVGTDGSVTVDLNVTGGNATATADYGGTWPTQVVFADGQTESVVSLPIVHDNDPNEGCEFVQVGLTAVSGTGSAVLNGGIHDVSAEAVVLIEEDDFTSAVRTTAPPEGLDAAGGGLSPATAEVVIADAAATWPSNVTLSVVGTAPIDRSLSLPLDVLFLAESDTAVAADLERLADLMPGLVAEMQATYSSVMFGAASFTTTASSYDYELLERLTVNVYPVVTALDGLASNTAVSEGPPGAQVAALYDAADDGTNEAGWSDGGDGDVFRVAVVVTGSHFADSAGFDSLDTSTWTIPHGVTVSALQSRLSSAGVHPIFLLTDSSLEDEYRALVGEIGFGAVAAVNLAAAVASNYNDDYLPQAMVDGLEALFAQAALLVQSDEGGFVASISPAADAFRNRTLGEEVNFLVNMSATSVSAAGSGGVMLSFQGHKTVVTVVREFTSCAAISSSRVSGTAAAASDDARAGWLQGFHEDEATKWTFDSAFSVGNKSTGPFGVPANVLAVSCPGGCSDQEAYQDITMAVDSELPMVIKAYFYLSASSTATVATASLDATYSSGGFDENFGFLDFGASTGDGVFGTWTQSISAVYPTQVVTSARVKLSFSGTGEAAFGGVALFAHPDVACRCEAGYFLDVGSAPALACEPQPECTYFEGWCTYCPAGYKCPQGGVLTACLAGEYSMGGYVECFPCPVGWRCSQGLGVPCGYGTSLGSATTNAQEEEGSTSSVAGTYGGSCISCPAGMECPGGGVWQECEPGTHSPGGEASNVCMPCLPGTFANDTAAAKCMDCPPGSTSNYGAMECFECPPGFTSEAGQHPCAPCDAGTYATAGDSECAPCAIGYYAEQMAMWACEQCPDSTNTSLEGSASEADCIF